MVCVSCARDGGRKSPTPGRVSQELNPPLNPPRGARLLARGLLGIAGGWRGWRVGSGGVGSGILGSYVAFIQLTVPVTPSSASLPSLPSLPAHLRVSTESTPSTSPPRRIRRVNIVVRARASSPVFQNPRNSPATPGSRGTCRTSRSGATAVNNVVRRVGTRTPTRPRWPPYWTRTSLCSCRFDLRRPFRMVR